MSALSRPVKPQQSALPAGYARAANVGTPSRQLHRADSSSAATLRSSERNIRSSRATTPSASTRCFSTEKPSIGVIPCTSANGVQLRLALTAATRKIGVATYQTALPEERLILQTLERLRALREPKR